MVIKFVKFYRGADDKAFAVSDDGLVFSLSTGTGFGFVHVEQLPDGAHEVTIQEWAAAHLPDKIEFNVAGEKEETQERELTPEEHAMDDAWSDAVRVWRQERAETVARAVRDAVDRGLGAFEFTETVTKSYNSPALLAAVAAVIGSDQPPEDPIEWRRADQKGQLADIIREMMPSVIAVIGNAMNAKVQAKVTRTPAPQPAPQGAKPPSPPLGSYMEQLVAAGVIKRNLDGTYLVSKDVIERIVEAVRAQVVPPQPSPAPRPAPTPPAEPKAEEKGQEAGK